MTDTAAREEAVERVRALAEGAMQPHEWGYRDPVVGGFVEDRTPFDLADHVLRLLLSGGDGGSVASLPVKAVDEPATPLSDALLAARQALEPFVAFINVAEDAATMNWGVQIEDSKVVGSVSGETGSAKLRAKDLRRAREANAAIQAALTDPRQPSEAPVTADEVERLRRLVDMLERLNVIDRTDDGHVVAGWIGEANRRRKEMAVEITGLRRSYTDEKVKATRAEAHAERLAKSLDGVIAVADRNTPEFREARQALSAYNSGKVD